MLILPCILSQSTRELTQSMPICLVHREDLIRDELSKLWKSCTFDSVIKCRSMYIRLAVDLGASKWTCNALANSIQTAKKPEVLFSFIYFFSFEC